MNLQGIFISDFNLKPEYFDHQSKIHGIPHTYRVMCNVLKIGTKISYPRETKLAFFAAFIHDMARQHDGRCADHGRWSVEKKLDNHLSLFIKNGINPEDKDEIATALTNHCLRENPPEDHPHYTTTAILKDADALDRVRISRFDLKLKFLRFHESTSLKGFAEKLYYTTRSKDLDSFSEYLQIARNL